jgi:hypothetical protein
VGPKTVFDTGLPAGGSEPRCSAARYKNLNRFFLLRSIDNTSNTPYLLGNAYLEHEWWYPLIHANLNGVD